MKAYTIKDSIYVVMPTYNEEANIVSVVEEWYPVVDARNDASRLVIADGGSKDRTLVILHDLAKRLPKLEVVSMPGTDHGTKVLWLYKHAVECGAEWVFQTDSDGQTRASEFDAFWADREQYDAILGNRVARGDGFRRKMVELGLRLFVLAYFGIWIPDANAPFRLMRSRLKIGDDLSLTMDGVPVRDKIVYTGALDELFGFRCGALPYRSLRFEWVHEDIASKQPAPVVAYPQEPGYTRITEYKKLPFQDVKGTSLAYEYPLPISTENEPYYPVLTEESARAYSQYQELARMVPNLVPCGRLGCFKYFNMDQAIEAALEVSASL